ncbi:MAG: hypothetical protein KTR15_14290 [Phycisphaeraceae bacterium]|nr:hypothetical protein [Phycisphaeraceae bacterium]
MNKHAKTRESLAEIAKEHAGERIVQVLRSEADCTKGVELPGICGEDWEYYSFWLKLESNVYLDLSTSFHWGVSCKDSLDEKVFPVEVMSDWINDAGSRLKGIHVHDYDDGDGPMVEFELSGGLVLSSYNSPGGTVLDLFEAPPLSDSGTRVMSWPQCAV